MLKLSSRIHALKAIRLIFLELISFYITSDRLFLGRPYYSRVNLDSNNLSVSHGAMIINYCDVYILVDRSR